MILLISYTPGMNILANNKQVVVNDDSGDRGKTTARAASRVGSWDGPGGTSDEGDHGDAWVVFVLGWTRNATIVRCVIEEVREKSTARRSAHMPTKTVNSTHCSNELTDLRSISIRFGGRGNGSSSTW